RNLDNALVAASDKSPAAVAVTYVKGAPVVTVGGYYVATVDANSAKAEGLTPAVLAERWANSLRKALSDKASTNSYVAHLSGDTTASLLPSSDTVSSPSPDPVVSESRSPVYNKARRGYVPAGRVLPLTLTSGITTKLAKAGDKIEAKVSEDVSLGESYIPKGTLITGLITEVKAGDKMA